MADYTLQPVDNDPFAVPDSSKIAVMPTFARAPKAAEDIAAGVAEPLTTAGWMLGGAMQGTERPSTVDVLKAIGGIGLAAMPIGPGRAAGLARGVEEAATPVIRAFHGSPHDFNAFDMSKIGTGEGAQAYGHGLYFAENEATAKAYRDALAKRDMEGTAAALVRRSGGDWNKALTEFETALGNGPVPAELQGTLDELRRGAPGKMYEVGIKAHPEHFLEWDKPIGEQSPHVKEALTGLAEKNPALKKYIELAPEARGDVAYQALGGSHKGAEALREAGVAGIKYADQGSRGTGGGTSNYVVFSDKLIDIVKKYGIAGTIGAGAYHFKTQPVDHDPFSGT